MKRLLSLAAVLAALVLAAGGRANAAGGAHYYLALGDSLARSAQPNGDFQHGYADQLLALLQQQDPSLRLVKLGCEHVGSGRRQPFADTRELLEFLHADYQGVPREGEQ